MLLVLLIWIAVVAEKEIFIISASAPIGVGTGRRLLFYLRLQCRLFSF